MSNYVPSVGRPLGSTPESKALRYSLMGLASVGVLGYYWKHKSPWIAGAYAVMAYGYYATSKDYKDEAKALKALPKVAA